MNKATLSALAISGLLIGCETPGRRIGSLPIQPPGWMGADGATAVQVSSGTRIWAFSDSLIGEMRNGKRVDAKFHHNTVGVEKDGVFEYAWGDSKAGVFRHRRPGYWYWPSGLFLHEDRLHVLLKSVHMVRPNDPLGFEEEGVDVAVVENHGESPDRWRYSLRKLPLEPGTIAVAAGKGGGFLYLLVDDKSPDHRLHLARIGFGSLERGEYGMEFYSPSHRRWTPDFSGSDPLFETGSPEASLSYDPREAKWRAVFTPKGLSRQVVLHESSKITGPWSRAKTLYVCDEMDKKKEYFCYSGKEIPGEEFRFTYNVNSFDFWDLSRDPSIYVPRVLKLEK